MKKLHLPDTRWIAILLLLAAPFSVQAAEDAGRLFPLSLASEGSCRIGGNLSTNAGGVQVLRDVTTFLDLHE